MMASALPVLIYSARARMLSPLWVILTMETAMAAPSNSKTMETVVEVGPVPIVPFGEPLTQELADNFKPYLQKYNTFLMENHGLGLRPRISEIVNSIEQLSSVGYL